MALAQVEAAGGRAHQYRAGGDDGFGQGQLTVPALVILLGLLVLDRLLGGLAAILDVVYHIPLLANLSLVALCGLMIGLANGYMAAYLRIPSFIVTLAGMLVFRGLTLWLLGGQNIGPFPKSFQALSTGFIPDLFMVGKPNVTALVVSRGHLGLRQRGATWTACRTASTSASSTPIWCARTCCCHCASTASRPPGCRNARTRCWNGSSRRWPTGVWSSCSRPGHRRRYSCRRCIRSTAKSVIPSLSTSNG